MLLVVVCLAQFVFILDVSVVNVALVPLRTDLGVGDATLPLVAAVYAATFGGVLLLGGRLADRDRTRTVFVTGLIVFAVSSALCGAAWDPGALVTGRAAQGIGAGLASPAALALLTVRYAEGAARDRALAVWAAVAAAGGAVGLVLGGALTTGLGWRSVFFVNVPLVAVIVAAALRVIPADRNPQPAGRSAWASAACAGGGMVAVVLGLSMAPEHRSVATVGALLLAGAVLVVVHRVVDRRSAQPLIPAALLRNRVVLAADAVTAALSAVVLGVNFFLAVQLQGRLGLGPMTTGLAFLPITAVSAATALAAARLVGRLGAGRLLALALSVMAIGAALLSVAGDGYWAVLPGMVLVAAGMGPGFTVGSIAATGGVPAQQQGAAGALLSTATQIGAAVGLAVFGVLAALPADPADGARLAYLAMTLTAALAALLAVTVLRTPQLRRSAVTPVPAHAASCLPGCATPDRVLRPRGLRP